MRIDFGDDSDRRFALIVRAICVAVALANAGGDSACCRGEIPSVSVLIKADGDTKFSKLLPIIERAKPAPITFAINEEPGISIIIQVRSDWKILERAEILVESSRERKSGEPKVRFLGKESIDQWQEELRKVGADRVSVATRHVLSTAEFSVEAVEELRKQKRRLIIVCLAEWHLHSAKFEETLQVNREVIAAGAKSDTVIMLVDMTYPLFKEKANYFREIGVGPFCFLSFAPGRAEPVVITDLLTPKEFIQFLSSDEELGKRYGRRRIGR